MGLSNDVRIKSEVKQMKKYKIAHWTAGNYQPNLTDLTHYQMLVNGDGLLIKGQEKTASTGGMNSITYNISCCCRKNDNTPLKRVQFEAMCKHLAQVCKDDGTIPMNVCFTHYEIGKMVQNGEIKRLLPYNKLLEQNIGKIDFKFLDFLPEEKNCGDFMRKTITWYYNKL